MPLDAVQLAAQVQFGRQSRNYGSNHILADTSDVEAALARIQLPPGATVLDVATGGGHTGLFLAKRGHRVTCADIAPEMLQTVRQAALAQGVTVQIEQHAAEEMPYDPESFDLVTCRVAPHHFSSPEAFVRESARVLRRGGHFLLIDGSVPDNEREADAWMNAVEKLRDPSHVRLLPPSKWKEFCAHAGLNVLFAELCALKQPDLRWYFETAGTSPENRQRVLELIASASEHVRSVFRITDEGPRISWWWPRLTLVARRP
jgi:SAM-dependent methyltransferase